MTSKTGIVITGASRGFGRALAVVGSKSELARPSGKGACAGGSRPGLELVLVARSTAGLDETKELVERELAKSSEERLRVNIFCHGMDLSDLDTLDHNLDTILDTNLGTCDRIFFFNNAGSIGFLGPSVESPSLQAMRDNVDLNITSCLWTSVRFAKWAQRNSISTTIVNISSLVAVADFPTFGIYSSGKAARDKYHTLMSKEMDPSCVRTLNYAPGPLETEMVDEIRKAPKLDQGLKPHFHRQLLDPKESAGKVFRLLERGDFENGAHVDYYDLPDL